MIPAGYMAKSVAMRPEWLAAHDVEDIYSVSGCVSAPFTDYVSHWRHNAYWFFNSVGILAELAKQTGVDLTKNVLVYYEIFEKEFDETSKEWAAFETDQSLDTDVATPANAQLMGFDVTSFTAGHAPECSPLSCNSLAEQMTVNCHCLLDTFEQAVEALEAGYFDHGEPGPFRILSVWKVESISA